MASVALLAEAMLEFIAAVVGWLASLRSTEAGVLLPSTWTWRASRADWLALLASPRVRLVFTAVRLEVFEAMRPLCGCQVRGQSIGSQVWRRKDSSDLGLQRCHGGRVDADVRGVGRDVAADGGRVREWGVGRSCPVVMPDVSLVRPSLRMFPVMEDSNRDIFTYTQTAGHEHEVLEEGKKGETNH